jgi:hypothetical protein
VAGRTEIPDDLVAAAFVILDGEEGADFKTENGVAENGVAVAAAMSALWLAICDRYVEVEGWAWYPPVGVHERTNRCVYTPVCQPLYRKVQG